MTAAGCARVPYRVAIPEREGVQPAGKSATAADHNKVGVTYESAGQYEKAIRAYRKSLVLEPENHVARTNLGNVLGKLCHFDKAEECYRDVLAKDPENLAAMNNLAWLLVSTGDTRECEEGIKFAGKCLSLAEKAAPGIRPSLLDTLAWGNYRLQRQSEALRHARLAADLLGEEELKNNPLIWGHYRTIVGIQGRWAQ
ncbi:tetratricopeptide repeat protein [Candidatus Poribacteria bacterium]|nr:tetratricopeptide repeat protein [Candidatus Poribacteria bacterium]